jgi:hypothetical protein
MLDYRSGVPVSQFSHADRPVLLEALKGHPAYSDARDLDHPMVAASVAELYRDLHANDDPGADRINPGIDFNDPPGGV